MTEYKTILFDLDGTLTDSKEGITRSVRYALESLGENIPGDEILNKFIGPPLKESFMKYCGLSDDKTKSALEKYRERFSVTGIYENSVYDGIESLLKLLKANGKKLIVATAKPEIYANRIIEHFGLAPYFDFIAGSEFDGARTNKNDVMSYVFELLDISDRSTVIMVGDREHDVIGAKSQGIPCIGVLYGYGSRTELEAAGADYIVETVADLRRFLCG